MADELGPAIVALQQKLSEQLRAVTDTKRTINMLLKMSGQSTLYTEEDAETGGSVRADQFYGKGLATAAAEYLAMRKQACQPDEILRALAAGGFDFDLMNWEKDQHLRLLALSLAKNTGSQGKFHRLKNGSFGLRSWYDEDFLKKASADAADRAVSKKKKAAKKSAQKAKAPVAEAKQPELVKSKVSAKLKDHGTAAQSVQKEAAS
jgi:hypothetical protein